MFIYSVVFMERGKIPKMGIVYYIPGNLEYGSS